MLLGSGGSDDVAAAGKDTQAARLDDAMQPVEAANRSLSRELDRLSGTKGTSAKAALRRAEAATTRAQGAVAAIDAPAAQRAGATQLLDREAAYLSGVRAVLNNPSSPTRSELGTLGSNLASAISAADTGLLGTSQDVSGADRLTSWATRTARTLRRRAAVRRRAAARRSATARAPAAGTAGFAACDQNISARRGSTSCAFASNVFWAYWYFTTTGQGTRFTAYSPANGTIYDVTCSGATPVVCTTRTGAEIHFPQRAVDLYSQSAADAYSSTRDLGPDPTALTGGV